MNLIPTIPVDLWVQDGVDWIGDNLAPFFDFVTLVLDTLNAWVNYALTEPFIIAIILSAAAIALVARGWKMGIFALLGFAFIDSMGMWESAMSTLTLVLIASAVALVLAFPIGILAARSRTGSTVIRPVLDFMQTLPPFVYLVPAISFFSIGVVPGMVATVVFAMPPGVRLTELGIRQVDAEMVEAGEAFGARPRQILSRIQIPLAMPTIMAGVNQVIMLALSMVVLAGFVGAGGLGADIYLALQRVRVGLGFEAGFAVVIIAIFLDRVTGAIATRRGGRGSILGRMAGAFRSQLREQRASRVEGQREPAETV